MLIRLGYVDESVYDVPLLGYECDFMRFFGKVVGFVAYHEHASVLKSF